MNESIPEIEEEPLLNGLRAGDLSAFETIYEHYWYPLFLVAFRKLKSKEIAEELVQDIFVKLWERRATVQIIHLRYYLFSAIRYAVIDHIRTQINQEQYNTYYRAFLTQEDVTTEETIVGNELLAILEDGLKTLPEKSKKIFRLNYLDNWSVSQIAVHLHLSEKAVEYHLTKAVKFLRMHCKEHFIVLALYYMISYP
ncbi:MAG: RNA polymerase sigma-70 factor [Hymenobacter sp.]|nr:MAG: RNA polymerase sigma-70 factor [Hymenobacter sp.]